MKFMGTRFQLTKPDENEVERGVVHIPVGHWATVGEYCAQSRMYQVHFDNDAEGLDMGWCLYTAEEILEQLPK